MRSRLISLCLIGMLGLAPGLSAQTAAKSAEVLTNQSIVQMVLGKLSRDLIQAKIQSSKTDFDVTIQGLVGLQTNKVPTDIIKAMMSAGPKKASSEVLTNESVIQMITAKMSKDVILAKIQSTKTNFDVSSAGLVNLNTNKVPNDVIKVMMAGGGGKL